ncbi:MAG: cysteine hydrolase [Azoarcus sp.]|nr:cysteine hydrolase [Azoarcus sp.]
MNALLIIDIQNDYFPGGKMELAGSEAAVIKAEKLLNIFRNRELPVFHIQHISTRLNATSFLPQTEGANIHINVAPIENEKVIQKNYPNSFRETSLLKELRDGGITNLVVVGMMTQMCVDTTVRAAADLGFSCWLAHDACAAKDLSFAGKTVAAADVQTSYMAALNGLFAEVLDTGTIVSRLEC